MAESWRFTPDAVNLAVMPMFHIAGSGWAMILVGLAIALAPGRDGGDLAGRRERYRSYWVRRWESPRWRFGIGHSRVPDPSGSG